MIEGLDKVEGVPKGGFAVLTKIHHAAIDGVSGAELAGAIHDIEPDAEPEPPEQPWVPERTPTLLEMAARTTLNNARNPFRFARMLGRTAPGLGSFFFSGSGASEDDVENSGPVPRTRLQRHDLLPPRRRGARRSRSRTSATSARRCRARR